MARVSRESASGGGDFGPVDDRNEVVHGYRVSFATFKEDIDATPLLRELPDGRCQCPHWGYVIRGSVTFRFPDRDEVYSAGDAFYTEPGHVPVQHQPGSEVVMFSPEAELAPTEAAIMKSLQEMQPA
jgi:hypothetical protein